MCSDIESRIEPTRIAATFRRCSEFRNRTCNPAKFTSHPCSSSDAYHPAASPSPSQPHASCSPQSPPPDPPPSSPPSHAQSDPDASPAPTPPRPAHPPNSEGPSRIRLPTPHLRLPRIRNIRARRDTTTDDRPIRLPRRRHNHMRPRHRAATQQPHPDRAGLTHHPPSFERSAAVLHTECVNTNRDPDLSPGKSAPHAYR